MYAHRGREPGDEAWSRTEAHAYDLGGVARLRAHERATVFFRIAHARGNRCPVTTLGTRSRETSRCGAAFRCSGAEKCCLALF